MKKIIFFAAAALLSLAACSKQESGNGPEISFQIARYSAQTKADPADYKDNYLSVPFGAYAWYKGVSAADNTTFMTNQKVSYNSAQNVWKPEGSTYYWPKTGSIDFICYAPYTADGSAAPAPAISENSIAYADWDVAAHPDVDVMYADKAPGMSNNVTTYYYNGVPTLFHHALARVSFRIRAAYLEKTDPDTNTKTRWEVTVNSIGVGNVFTKGSLDLSLNADGKSWDKPADNIWVHSTNPADKTDISLDVSAIGGVLTTGITDLNAGVLVLPQDLTEGQLLNMNLTIKTYRDINDGNGEKLVLTETAVPVSTNISGGTLTKWGMNKNIIYTFILAPSKATGTGVDNDGDGIEDLDPTIVYFDPAVSGWEDITVDATINI
jgi:hypothetical protein